MATSKINNTPIYKFTKEVTFPKNSRTPVDITNDIPNRSNMKGYDVGFKYTDHYYDLVPDTKVVDSARPMFYVRNTNEVYDITNELQIVVFY